MQQYNISEFYPVVGCDDSIKAIPTGEFRSPKKGEYYIDDCKAYKAFSDLILRHPIAKKVRVEKVTSYKILGPV